jgi:hypothetical protein
LSETEEMDILLSDKELKIGDKKVIVKKLSLLNTVRIASQLSGIISSIMQDSTKTADAIAKMAYDSTNTTEALNIKLMGFMEILNIVGDDGVELLNSIIEKSTNLTDDEVEELSAEDGLDVVYSIYEVNKGFFTKLTDKLSSRTKIAKPKKEKATKKEK